jgi:hypothetical protein
VLDFAAEHWHAVGDPAGDTIACTHNVPLRVLVGQSLGVPASSWHRLSIEHLRPYAFVQSRRYGLFADLDEALCETTFALFVMHPAPAQETSPYRKTA